MPKVGYNAQSGRYQKDFSYCFPQIHFIAPVGVTTPFHKIKVALNWGKPVEGMLGGLSEQGINNMTGMSDGLTLNVLNSRDFGLKNEVGMVTVTLGGNKGFDWDVSRGGLNVSASGIKGMYEGMERVKLYNEVMNGGNKGLQVAYMADNKSRYSYDNLSEKEKAEYKNEYGKLINEIEDYLHGNSEIGFNFNTDKNMRLGDTIFITDTLVNDKDFKVEDGLIHMDLNKAAKLASLISHELMHDGKIIGDVDQEDEEIKAHEFDTIVWRGLKEKFGVKDALQDSKLLAFKKSKYMVDEEYFANYLRENYVMDEEASDPPGNPGFYINLATGAKKDAEAMMSLPIALAINTFNSMGNWFVNVFSGKAEIEPVAEINILTMPLDPITSTEQGFDIPIPISTSIGNIGMFEVSPYVEIYEPDDDFLDIGIRMGAKAGIGPFNSLAEVKVGFDIKAPTYGKLGTLQYGNFGYNLLGENNKEHINRIYGFLRGDYWNYYEEW
ncbi:hypothetical protein ES703_112747 [subsurface metagenome]